MKEIEKLFRMQTSPNIGSVQTELQRDNVNNTPSSLENLKNNNGGL